MRWCFCGYSCVAISVTATRIYREDMSRVTTSHNRLVLSLLKRIGHELIAKINGKRRSRVCEALGQILTDYSRAHHAPACLTSPRPARRDEASERARVFPHFSSPPHTYKCIESNSSYK
jgi:hypothetical protein